MMRGVGSSLAVLALIGALWPLAANADERKQLAFDVVERNAEQMALLSDSIFYFGELGMQEKIETLNSAIRSEEHTSELQSPCNLVCRLLLEKKKRYTTN